MSLRKIVLDTETTGIRVEEGHRIIEIGCLEMIDRKLTGKSFHHYINPEREIEAGAIAIHGISNEFLKDKPLFGQLVDDFIQFVSDAELIIHNAPFDLSFLNNELRLAGHCLKNLADHCNVVDTLVLARQLHVGQRNNLDALCKRYGIDHTKREFHGALLDAQLLAEVYLAMTGGQGSFFDAVIEPPTLVSSHKQPSLAKNTQEYVVKVVSATEEEIKEHLDYLAQMKKSGKCLWPELDEVLDAI